MGRIHQGVTIPTVARATAAIGFGLGCLHLVSIPLGAIIGPQFLPDLPD
ncbi:MAG: hypothetical protein PHQ81_09675 [Methanofollis sp.]|nr:hypothetical protein [Methanofollis sp.]